MQHTLLGPERVPPRHGSLLRASRRHGGDLRRLRAGDAGRVRRRPRAVPALVRAGGHAGGDACAARYDAATRHVHARPRAAHAGSRPGSRTSCRSTSRSRSAWSTATAATSRCARRRGGAGRHDARARRCAKRGPAFRFAGIDVAARAVAAARLLGAGEGRLSTTPTTSSRSSPRTTATRSTAGTPRSAASPARCCSLARDHRDARAIALPLTLVGIVEKLLADRASDPALIALALTPPDRGYVAALEPVLDVDGVVAARTFVMRELGARLARAVRECLSRARVRAPYAPTTRPDRRPQARQRVPALSRRARRSPRRGRSRSLISIPPTT